MTSLFGARRVLSGSVLLIVGVFAMSADAGATLRVQNHLDPAGDPTEIPYQLGGPSWPQAPIQMLLSDGESESHGVDPGTYTIRALPPAGWRVNAIRCVSSLLDPGQFVYDVANGTVTVTHPTKTAEQTCAFTNGKVGVPPSSAVDPSPPAGEVPEASIPKEIALLRVRAGRGFVEARLRLIRRSTIGLQIRRGTRVLARKRAFRRGGVRVVRLYLRPETRRWLRSHGRKRVLVKLRVRVTDRRGTRKVFWYGVIVPV
jgi:hypothetical protein